MSTLLKDKYSVSFYEGFLDALAKTGNSIPKDEFFDKLMDVSWEEKSLKQRMRHTTLVWRTFQLDGVENQAKVLVEIINYLKSIHSTEYSLEYLFLADFIVLYFICNPNTGSCADIELILYSNSLDPVKVEFGYTSSSSNALCFSSNSVNRGG
jgi:hypothetical protein